MVYICTSVLTVLRSVISHVISNDKKLQSRQRSHAYIKMHNCCVLSAEPSRPDRCLYRHKVMDGDGQRLIVCVSKYRSKTPRCACACPTNICLILPSSIYRDTNVLSFNVDTLLLRSFSVHVLMKKTKQIYRIRTAKQCKTIRYIP